MIRRQTRSGAYPCWTRREHAVYVFEPASWDLIDPRPHHPPKGTRVVKTQPAGTPENGTLGHCFVVNAETGEFYRLVAEASLQAVAG